MWEYLVPKLAFKTHILGFTLLVLITWIETTEYSSSASWVFLSGTLCSQDLFKVNWICLEKNSLFEVLYFITQYWNPEKTVTVQHYIKQLVVFEWHIGTKKTYVLAPKWTHDFAVWLRRITCNSVKRYLEDFSIHDV